MRCVRSRANAYGVSQPNVVRLPGGGTRTRYLPVHQPDPKNWVWPKVKKKLPTEILGAVGKWKAFVAADRWPLVNGYAMRSESKEAINALMLVALPRMDTMSYRVGVPDDRQPGKMLGLSIDYDLARLTRCSGCGMGRADSAGFCSCGREISESRLEEAIERVKELDWFEWDKADPGRRAEDPTQAPKAGFIRKSSQQVEETETGEFRGRAAIRQLADELFKAILFDQVMARVRAEKYEKAKLAAARQREGCARTRAPRTVEELEACFPPPEIRERPP